MRLGVGLGVCDNLIVGEWTPANISTRLWLDAADSSTITESSNSVSQWDDKSGNGLNVTQGTGSQQPLTNQETLNGLNLITFDGVDDVLTNTNSVISGSARRAVFIAGRLPIGNLLFDMGTAFTTRQQFVIFKHLVGFSGSNVDYTEPSPNPVNSVVAMVSDGPNTEDVNCYADGVQLGVSSTLNPGLAMATGNGVSVGGTFQPAYGESGIGEVLILDYEPDSDLIDTINNYMMNKWGLG